MLQSRESTPSLHEHWPVVVSHTLSVEPCGLQPHTAEAQERGTLHQQHAKRNNKMDVTNRDTGPDSGSNPADTGHRSLHQNHRNKHIFPDYRSLGYGRRFLWCHTHTACTKNMIMTSLVYSMHALIAMSPGTHRHVRP